MERGGLIRQTELAVRDPDVHRTDQVQQHLRGVHGAGRLDPADVHASWEDTNMYERCITRGLPGAMIPGFYNHNYLILLIVDPPDGPPHLRSGIRQWLGDSRGRWEGDTLVVETTNFTPKAEQRAHYLVVTAFSTGKNLHLVERFTRTDADTIDYRFTVTVTSSGVVRMESSA